MNNNPLDQAQQSLERRRRRGAGKQRDRRFRHGGIKSSAIRTRPESQRRHSLLPRRQQHDLRRDGTSDAAADGIAVAQNASPTLLNDIIANVQNAVAVDATSTTTVLGYMLYQNITNALYNTGIGTGTSPIFLAPSDPLFVDPAAGNFYLMEGSQAVDTALTACPIGPAW